MFKFAQHKKIHVYNQQDELREIGPNIECLIVYVGCSRVSRLGES